MAKKKDWQKASLEDMKSEIRELDRAIFDLRNELATQRKLEKPHLIKAKRREKARIFTFLTKRGAA